MKNLITPLCLALGFVVATPVMAQMDHSMHGSPAASAAPKAADAAMGEGLVKKTDKTKGTVTLAHGAMNGMPPMTMAYKVKDLALLDKLKVGQKIRFATDPADGGMTVTRIESVN